MMEWDAWLAIDRRVLAFFNESGNLFADSLATTLTSGLTWIPLYLTLLYLVIHRNDTLPRIAWIVVGAAASVALADVAADLIVKPWVARWRPTNDPLIKYTIDVVGGLRGDKYSFFSAHAANTMAVATYFSLLVRSRRLTVALVFWSLLNCWTRLYLGLHYPSDILVGLLWGAVAGWTGSLLLRRIDSATARRVSMPSRSYTTTGYGLTDIDRVISMLTLTIAAALVMAAYHT